MASTLYSDVTGTPIVASWLNDVNTATYQLLSFGAVGNGVTDDKAAIALALASGRLIDGQNKTYAISGTLTVTGLTTGGLRNAKLVQIAPTTSLCKTLQITDSSGFILDNITIDRGGSAGYTVGDNLTTVTGPQWAGLTLNNCSRFSIQNLLVTNGGRGSAWSIWNSTDFDLVNCRTTEHYWQEVVPGSPVIVDDIIQPFYLNNCTRWSMRGGGALNCTSGAPGNPATNVAASAVRNFSRCAFGGNTQFSIDGVIVSNVAQCYDFTGSVGNSNGTITGCHSINAGVSGFKVANNNSGLIFTACISNTADQYGFLISGPSGSPTPYERDIHFVNCIALNTGGVSSKYLGTCVGFLVEAKPADITYPRSVIFTRCDVIDRQGTPTTNTAFSTSVAAIEYPTTGYNLPHTIRTIECKVDVPGLSNDNYFVGIHHARCVAIGNPANNDSIPNLTWTTVTFDGPDISDSSGLHNPSNNPSNIYIKESGQYVIKVQSAFPASSTNFRAIRILVNGGNAEDTGWSAATGPNSKIYVQGTFTRTLYTGDIVTVQVFQDSGSSVNVNRGDNFISLVKVN